MIRNAMTVAVMVVTAMILGVMWYNLLAHIGHPTAVWLMGMFGR